ncbi:MAG TPA: SDR family oxidoreductase [Gemmatimonas sp.]|uniref:SDR family oxidoreductase n=1 Tax=Gemmatimonas sp. TaxID=1962908 RepID=UPI002EDA7F4D
MPKEPQEPKPPFPAQHQKRPGLEARMEPRPNFEGAEYRAADKLKGRVALISGGDSGIGRSVGVLFAREGANVAFLHLEEEREDAAETLQHIRDAGGEALALAGDIRDPAFCRRAVAHVVDTFGAVDILVNNAAWQHRQDSLEDISDEQLDRTINTNILGSFYLTRAALPHLPRGGAIINTGSITGLEGSEDLLDYAATKGAIHAFTKSLARNLVHRGIRVNCVAPGPVWTPLNVADKPAKEAGRHGMKTPMGRPAQPEEIAPAFVFFASAADSSYITGEVLTLLGGNVTAA